MLVSGLNATSLSSARLLCSILIPMLIQMPDEPASVPCLVRSAPQQALLYAAVDKLEVKSIPRV